MKIFSLLAFCTVASLGLAQETAYQALNSVGKSKGEPYLDKLLNLEGLDGSSQPGNWRMIFEDADARGGFREIEVRGGEIVSQRTPLKNAFGSTTPVNLDRLQLDSDGAFTVAEREAVRRQLRFASANYLLTTAGPTGAPVWRVELLDSSSRIVQTLRISADTGKVLGAGSPSRPNVPNNSNEPIESSADEPSNDVVVVDEPESESDSTELKINRSFRRAGRSISNGFKHIGGSLQEVFTGRRTIDKNLPDE